MIKILANPISCHNPCRLPGDCVDKVVSTKSEEVMHQKTSTPRPPPIINLKEAWQVQRDEQFQRGSGIGKLVADKEQFEIDLRDRTRTPKIGA